MTNIHRICSELGTEIIVEGGMHATALKTSSHALVADDWGMERFGLPIIGCK